MEGTQDVIALSAETFHETMATTEFVACILHQGPFAACADDVLAVMDGSDGHWTWTRLDLRDAAEIGAMFGLADGKTSLLLMRDAVVVYCDGLTAVSPATTQTYLRRAATLDMSRVRAELETKRQSRQSLFARRVCPTALRTR
ncbi:MAG: hypothetical protein AAFY02_07265 [Pseudomonadota bacterium]